MSYEFNIFEIIAEIICNHCRYNLDETVCSNSCYYKSYFDELETKCVDINRDANYLLDLVIDEDNQADDDDYE